MTYKPTGKPVGRPKTKEYVTLLARVPADLAALVKRYAAEHGSLPVAELIREGLEWRIGDGDPRGTGMYLREPTGIREQAYSSNTGTAPAPQGDETLQEVRALREQIQTLALALERQTTPAGNGVYSSNTIIEPLELERPEAQPTVLQAAQNPALARVAARPFDASKFYLGTLCPRGHDFDDTGMSLLRKHNKRCRECENESKREARARKKAAREANAV